MRRAVIADEKGMEEAVRLLRQGECVALPSETVYGLAADARSPQAVAKIFAAKDRPAENPLIVHVLDAHEAGQLIKLDDKAQVLAARYWPGPLTIVALRQSNNGIAREASAGLPTLGVRVPAHKIFRDVLQRCGFPLAAPSANASGTLSATTPQLVTKNVSLILAGGATDKGLESTIVDLSDNTPVLLRHGAIPIEDIEALIGPITDGTRPSKTPKSPGQTFRHYAPRALLRLNAVDVEPGEALLAFGELRFMGVKGGGWAKDLPEAKLRNLSPNGDLDEAAHNLFSHLHALDEGGAIRVAVMAIPDVGVGRAVNDRLRRACQAQEKP